MKLIHRSRFYSGHVISYSVWNIQYNTLMFLILLKLLRKSEITGEDPTQANLMEVRTFKKIAVQKGFLSHVGPTRSAQMSLEHG